jgi:hypothetical protein
VKLTRKTLVLLGLTFTLAAAWGAGTLGEDGTTTTALPSTPPLALAAVTRIVLAGPAQRVILARVEGEGAPRWNLVEPLKAPADVAQVQALLKSFGPGIPMLAEAGDGTAETFGFQNDVAVTVEIYTDGSTPAASLILGKSAGGPTAFVRIPGSDLAYRADVGGRGRYERPAAEWRDKLLLDVPTDEVAALVITRATTSGKETLRFGRGPSAGLDKDGNPVPGPWALLEGAPAGFRVDDPTLARIVGVLAGLRAGMIHHEGYEAGFEAPAAVAELELRDGKRHRLVLGARGEDGAAFVRVDDRAEVFRVSGQVGRMLTLPLEALRDRAIFQFEPSAVASMALKEGGTTVVLEQSADGARSWTVAQPANVDADQQAARKLVEDLAGLRADGLPPDTSFASAGGTLTLRLRDGRTRELEIGLLERDADNRPLVRVRTEGRVYQVKAVVVQELRRAFGRGG